jgi:hypothetical protein
VPSKSGRAVLVIGSVNMQEGKAELRTFEHIEAIHGARFKEPFELDRDQYWELVGKIQRFFEASNVKVTMAPLPGKIALDDDDLVDPPSGNRRIWLAALVVALAAAAAGLSWIRAQ